MKLPNEAIEERMMSEYVSEKLRGRKNWTHLRVGMPPGVKRGAPNWEYERQIKLPRLMEADVVYWEGLDVMLVEFKVRRFQEAIGKLQQYKILLPDTPDFFDVDPDRIRLKIVFGRPDIMAENLARSLGIEVEHYEPEWLKQAIIARSGGPI